MRIYSQKELLSEGFFERLIKAGVKTGKTIGKVMQAVDPKASEALLKPFKQTRDIYRSVVPGASETLEDKPKEFISSSKSEAEKFARKNPKIIQKIIDTEKSLYNRAVDPSSVSIINMKQPNGKAVQNLVVLSKTIGTSKKPLTRYMYSKDGKFIKSL